MTKPLKFLILLLIFSISTSWTVLATETGCLLTNSTLYPSKVNPGLINTLLGSTPIYKNGAYLQVAQQCLSTSRGPCRVCNGAFESFLGLITGCPTGFVYGYEVNYVVNCDFDSGTLTLLLVSACVGVVYIFKAQK